MKLAVISFTKAGSILCGSMTRRFRQLGQDCTGYVQDRFLNDFQEVPGICPVKESLAVWTKEQFDQVDGLIFIGAAGIAVRAIAPNLKDKMTDPAVVVMDEAGHYAISLLSGHLGGANELTAMVADITQATPVITTATDVNQKVAIDVWAVKRGFLLSDRNLAKQVAAELLEENPVGFYSDFPLDDPMPQGFTRGAMCRMNVWISIRKKPEQDHVMSMFLDQQAQVLRLIPPVLTVGIGCRKGISEETVQQFLEEVFSRENLDLRAVGRIATIDLKAKEQGLLRVASRLGVPFVPYSADLLKQVKGSVSSSSFVKEVTGIDNVCERAALAGAGEKSRLILKKQVQSGITIAIAEGKSR